MPTLTTPTYSSLISSSLGGVPTPGDSAYVGGNWTHDYSGESIANDWLLFNVVKGYSGRIGSAGGPLMVVCNRTGTGKFIYNAAGDRIYLASTSGAGVIQTIIHDPANNAEMHYSSGTTNELQLRSGSANIGAAVTLTNLKASGGVARVMEGGATLALAELQGFANAILRRPTTTIRGIGPNARIIGQDALGSTGLAPTLVELKSGAYYQHICAGNIATLTLDGGVCDLSQIFMPITIATLNITAPSRLILSKMGPQPTFTATNQTAPLETVQVA